MDLLAAARCPSDVCCCSQALGGESCRPSALPGANRTCRHPTSRTERCLKHFYSTITQWSLGNSLTVQPVLVEIPSLLQLVAISIGGSPNPLQQKPLDSVRRRKWKNLLVRPCDSQPRIGLLGAGQSTTMKCVCVMIPIQKDQAGFTRGGVSRLQLTCALRSHQGDPG